MSDFYNKYPYTDFHELNLDWVIERVKKLTEDWLATQEAWNNTQEEWQQLYNYVHDYFANLDVQDEINNKINQMILDGTFMTIVTPTINQTVVDATTTWLAEHIVQPTTPVVDNTLTIAGAAADAKTAGDRITDALGRINVTLPFKGELDSLVISDLDTILDNSTYVITHTGFSNLPIDKNGIAVVGTLLTFSSLNIGNYRGVQILIGRDNNLYIRTKASSTSPWTAWDVNACIDEIIENAITMASAQIIDNTVLTSADNAANNLIYRINVPGGNTPPANLPVNKNGILYTVGFNRDNTETGVQCFITIENVMYTRIHWGSIWTTWTKITVSYEETNRSFVNFGTPSRVIKNATITGYNDYILISNIRNNYNSVNGFTIYESDSAGTAGNVIREVTGIGTTGHYRSELPSLDRYSAIEFDYDLTAIPSGSRNVNHGYENLLNGKCYIASVPEKYGTAGFLTDFGVIGDSYASGEIYLDDGGGGFTAADYYNLSWGQILARKYGNTCTNFSKGGLTTRTWLTDAKGLTLLNSETAKKLYFCALGINDQLQYGTSYIGSISDIHVDPSENPDTFYGNYGKIIAAIQNKAPDAKIIMMTYSYSAGPSQSAFNTAIQAIATYYSIPCIVLTDSSFFLPGTWYYTGRKWNHPTAAIYAGMADAIERLLVDIVIGNSYFDDITG